MSVGIQVDFAEWLEWGILKSSLICRQTGANVLNYV
jgi:hypothetical protein